MPQSEVMFTFDGFRSEGKFSVHFLHTDVMAVVTNGLKEDERYSVL